VGAAVGPGLAAHIQPGVLHDAARLLTLPAYRGWAVELPRRGEVPALDAILASRRADGHPVLATPARGPERDAVTDWLRWSEGGALRARLVDSLQIAAAVHARCADRLAAGWAWGAASALRNGLALQDHPVATALAARSLGGRRADGRGPVYERGSGPRQTCDAGPAHATLRRPEPLAGTLAMAMRSAPGFGAWPGAPGDPEALDALAQGAAARACAGLRSVPSSRAGLRSLVDRALRAALDTSVTVPFTRPGGALRRPGPGSGRP